MSARCASTGRWAVASFSAGVALLALAALPFTAALAGGETFRRTAFAAVVVVAVCALAIVVALDLLGARSRSVSTRTRPRSSTVGRAQPRR